MVIRKREAVNVLILAIFLLSVSFANFFHTEEGPFDSDSCPACNLLKSTQATGQIHFFVMAGPALLGILNLVEPIPYSYVAVSRPSSRSPPQAG